MKRRLVKQGVATMMVSLPAKWIHKNKLVKGDEIDVEEFNNDLMISIGNKKSNNFCEIILTSKTETSIRSLIANAYRQGFDSIKIKNVDDSTLKTIKHCVRSQLVGFEISSTDKNVVMLENITEPSADQYNNIFSKVWLNLDELFNMVKDALEGKEIEPHAEISDRIQQYTNFCLRVAMKNNFMLNRELEWAFHTELVHGKRELVLILRYLEKNKVKVTDGTIKLLKMCKELFDTLQEAFKKKNIALLEKVHEIEKKIIYENGFDLLNKSGDNVVKYLILTATRQFYSASSPLMGLILSKKENKKEVKNED